MARDTTPSSCNLPLDPAKDMGPSFFMPDLTTAAAGAIICRLTGAGSSAPPALGGPIMKWTYDQIARFYTRARGRARCCKCGAAGLVEVPGGHPVRQGGGLQAVKERIRRVGFQCRKCTRGTAAADGSSSGRRRVDVLRKELKPFKDRHPDEMRMRREERIKRGGAEWNAEWEKESIAAGTWMDPDELEQKMKELKELTR